MPLSVCPQAFRLVLLECTATMGQVGNEEHENLVSGKAGRTRWAGRRPGVRGIVMNPVDHPMGGGEPQQIPQTSCFTVGTPAKGYWNPQAQAFGQVYRPQTQQVAVFRRFIVWLVH